MKFNFFFKCNVLISNIQSKTKLRIYCFRTSHGSTPIHRTLFLNGYRFRMEINSKRTCVNIRKFYLLKTDNIKPHY